MGDGAEKATSIRRRSAGVLASIGLIGGSLAVATPAHADDQGWACEVALCVSNPGGWMEFAECVPPIEKLISQLAFGGSFPVCVGGGMSSATYRMLRSGVGIVTIVMNDGTKTTYRVPTQTQVYNSPGYQQMIAEQNAAAAQQAIQ